MNAAKNYRLAPGGGRFRTFEIREEETDLLVGVDSASWDPAMAFSLAERVSLCRRSIKDYIRRYPFFASSWEPLAAAADAPEIVRRMCEAASEAGVGPMAAIAGSVAREACAFLREEFELREAFVENGGDCALGVSAPIVLSLNAGYSKFGGSLAFELPAGDWGVASSAGRLGHSKSYGAADACTVVARDASLADAWATAFGNRVGREEDIPAVLEESRLARGVEGICLVLGRQAGCRGIMKLRSVDERAGRNICPV